MHTLYNLHPASYQENIRNLVVKMAQQYNKTCYISFNDPFNIVVRFLETIPALPQEKFIVVDASSNLHAKKAIDMRTYTVPVHDIFRVYLFLRDIVANEKVNHLFLDSLSALIHKFPELPLQRSMTDFMLEVGSWKCDTSMVLFREHEQHPLPQSLAPFLSRNIVM